MDDCVDMPGECEERILDAIIDLCRGLHELNTKLIGEFAPLLLCDGALVCPVRLVADKNLVDSFGSVLFNVGMPCTDV